MCNCEKIRRNTVTIFVSVVIIFLSGSYSWGWGLDASEDVKEPAENVTTSVPKPQKKGWMLDEWAGDDLPYKKIRQEIDQLASEQLVGIADNYQSIFEKSQSDFNSLFGWAYASYRAKSRQIPNSYTRFAKAVREINTNNVPCNYEWTRLRFLITNPGDVDTNYKQLALRLLKHEPHDDEIKYFLLGILDLRDPGEKKIALAYLDELHLSKPDNLSLYTIEGSIYFKLWGIEDNSQYAKKSISAYQEFLQHAPANHSFRSRAKDLIELIEEYSGVTQDAANVKIGKSADVVAQ